MKTHFLVIFIGLIFLEDSLALTGRYRCMIRDEPSTTLTIGWEQRTGSNPMVYYGTTDEGQNYSKYTYHAYPKRTVHAKGMHNHYARLIKLRPNTVYYFVIKDSDAVSRRFSFKTLPDEHQGRLSIIGGGDSRNHKIARQNANKMVARCRPHFVLFAGDMTGGDSSREWQEWMDDWQLTIGRDGRMTAVVAARGNHERSDASIVDMFDVPNSMVYYGLTFSRGLMRIYTLNSMQGSNSSQLAWLESDLKESGQIAWRMAQYHHPMRPHTSRKHEHEFLRLNWGRLFHQYLVQLALECDSHMSKVTWPIRATNDKSEPGYDEGFVRDEEKGTVFIGEGGWGAPLRVADDSKRWTRAIGSFNQVKWLFVDLNKIEIRTIKTENVNEVSALTDNNRFFMPANVDLWEIDGAKHITLYNKNISSFVPKKAQILMEITASSAKYLNDQVHLEWKSIYEIARVKFKIQVSTNKLFWKTVDIITGQGPSASNQQVYKYTDKSHKRGGKYYYRIAAIDRTGKEYVQDYIEVRTLGSQELETIYGSIPGPLQVPVNVPAPTKVIIELFDTKRRQVFIREFQAQAGYQNLGLNIRHLSEGYYLLEISYDGKLIKKSVKISG